MLEPFRTSTSQSQVGTLIDPTHPPLAKRSIFLLVTTGPRPSINSSNLLDPWRI